tara:strand:+ start:299 stop:454 length:156 start_codon:yes stop_codon:yes gene_type:complete
MRQIPLTEKQETALVDALVMLRDLGCPDHIDEDAFDELCDRVFEPSPFEYS